MQIRVCKIFFLALRAIRVGAKFCSPARALKSERKRLPQKQMQIRVCKIFFLALRAIRVGAKFSFGRFAP